MSYAELGNSPRASTEAVARSMRGNRKRDTKPERQLRAHLRAAGIKGYRLNWAKATGTPDIAFPGKKVAVFVNGCYWHRCPQCQLPLPRSHTEFWKAKFEINVRRDAAVVAALQEEGWTVITAWECAIRTRVDEVVAEIKGALLAR